MKPNIWPQPLSEPQCRKKSPVNSSFNRKTSNSKVFQKIVLHSKLVNYSSYNCIQGIQFCLGLRYYYPNTSRLTVSWMTNRPYCGLRGLIQPPQQAGPNITNIENCVRMQEQVNIKSHGMITQMMTPITVSRDGLMKNWLCTVCADFRGWVEDVLEVE